MTSFDTRVDLFRFYRSLHLKVWHAQNTDSTPPNVQVDTITPDNTLSRPTNFKPKSRFSPMVPNAALITFTKKVDFEISRLMNSTPITHKSNLRKKEQNALDELSMNKDIIIRPADKGGAVVVISRDKYITEAHRQLNTRYYERLFSNPLPALKKEFDTFLQGALQNGHITPAELGFLTVEHPVTAAFYLLPKIHKEPKDNPPGRPIISGNGTLTEPASKFIDSFIKPLVRDLPSFLEDTTDVLNKVATIPNVQSQFLVTMDVESLYTNIDHQEGLSALSHYLSGAGDTVPSEFLLQLTDWVIHHNVFLFMDELYLQKIGVPMGSCFSPNYACLFLGLWESQYILNACNPFYECITWYGRYIDDACMVFNGSEAQLLDFHRYVNSINPNIRLTLEYSLTSINFLDVTIYKDSEGKLHTTLFRKTTSRNTILRADSFHPPHLINNIPYGQFQRLRRICDNDSDFVSQADSMTRRFKERAYPSDVVEQAYTKARSIPRNTLLIKNRQRRREQSRPYFVTTYSTLSPRIRRIITKNWSIIQSDAQLRGVFPEPPVLSFKRAPSLRDKLMQSHLKAQKSQTWLTRPIGTYKCMHCPHCANVTQAKEFVDVKTNKSYKQRDFINCNTTFVIYRLTCPCAEGFFYIGRTKRRLRDRLAEHKYAIRIGNSDYPMARHFSECHNSNDTLLRIQGVEHVKPLVRGGDRLKKLNQRETFWIHHLEAMEHPGLNEDIDFTCFL